VDCKSYFSVKLKSTRTGTFVGERRILAGLGYERETMNVS